MKKDTKFFWEEDPEFYGPRDYFRNSLIINKIKNYSKTGDILDFGCSCGNLVIRLAKAGYSVCAFDVSPISLKTLHNRIMNTPLVNLISIVEGDQDRLMKEYKKFNAICCGDVLEHIEENKEIVELFWKLLEKGGICIVTVPAREKSWDICDELAGHLRKYSKENLIHLFSSAGFEIKDFYCFGPMTLLWHKFIFLPIFRKRFLCRKNNKTKNRISVLDILLKREVFKRLFSYIFYVDLLFLKFDIWDYYLLVAKKNK